MVIKPSIQKPPQPCVPFSPQRSLTVLNSAAQLDYFIPYSR